MRPIDRLLGSSSSVLAQTLRVMKPRQFDQRLSEDDILDLQDIFLSNGLHIIKVTTIDHGRSLIYRLLHSMHYYRTIACLTSIEEPPLKKSIFDVYRALQMRRHNEDAIEDFFVDRFFVDFLWIELTGDLVKLPLFCHTLDSLDALSMSNHIPIVALSYDY